MAIEVVCDVAGCEERTPVCSDVIGALPAGWTMILSAPSEVEAKQQKAQMQRFMRAGGDLDMDMVGPPRGGSGKRVICPKHPLPQLKPAQNGGARVPVGLLL